MSNPSQEMATAYAYAQGTQKHSTDQNGLGLIDRFNLGHQRTEYAIYSARQRLRLASGAAAFAKGVKDRAGSGNGTAD